MIWESKSRGCASLGRAGSVISLVTPIGEFSEASAALRGTEDALILERAMRDSLRRAKAHLGKRNLICSERPFRPTYFLEAADTTLPAYYVGLRSTLNITHRTAIYLINSLKVADKLIVQRDTVVFNDAGNQVMGSFNNCPQHNHP